MAFDIDALINTHLVELFGEPAPAVYAPLKSAPGWPPFDVEAIFEREHGAVLDAIAKSELKSSGHSTTVPVASVRAALFPAEPKQNDQITIGGVVWSVWDVQPDGSGMFDLILRKA